MKSLKQFKEEQMKDAEFVKEYEDIQPELDVIRASVEARTSQNMTQKELVERTGIKIQKYKRCDTIKLKFPCARQLHICLNIQEDFD